MTTCRIAKEVQFDAGHRVPSHGSKCRNPHGHRYRVVVHCEGRIVNEAGAPDDGMLVDFGDLKGLMAELVHDVLDHGFIAYEDDPLLPVLCAYGDAIDGDAGGWRVVPFPYVPTAENLARWCWDVLEGPIGVRFRDGLRLVRVEVWETPTSVASYQGPTTWWGELRDVQAPTLTEEEREANRQAFLDAAAGNQRIEVLP